MIGIEAIKITPTHLAGLGRIDEFKGLWAAMETYTTGLQVLGDVAEHGANFRQVFGPLQDHAITPAMIGLIHASQVKGQSSGLLRREDAALNIPKDGKIIGTLETAAPEDIEPLLGKLVGWLNDSLARTDFHPLLTAAVFTAVFLQIGPYSEGNLRVARFLVLLIMLKAGYAYAPYVPLDRVMNERAEEVYQALAHNQASLEDGHPDWSAWLDCFFMLLQEQAEVLRSRLQSKDQELAELPTLSAKIMALFEEHPRLQMKKIIALTNGRRATVKLRLSELLEGGYLRRHGAGRSTWYSLV